MGAEISPVTGAIDYLHLFITFDLGDYTRILGFADMDFDGGPDFVVANSQNKIANVYFNGKRAQRISKKFFNPNVAVTMRYLTKNLVCALDINGDGSADIVNNPNGDSQTPPFENSQGWMLDGLKLIGATVTTIDAGPEWIPVSVGASEVVDPDDN
jgi:hypothetical protein